MCSFTSKPTGAASRSFSSSRKHCLIDQEAKAIAIHDLRGRFPVPCANLALLMIGPGTTVTHAAIRALADNGCLVAWCGEEGVRFYAQGMGETRSAHNLLRQAALCSHRALRLTVVVHMYRMRFQEPLDDGLTLIQIRGKEGIRVREAYARASLETGVPWSGRSYKRQDRGSADPINRALSAANSCLYGICHAAIISAGYSPALGFIHTGKMLSFVYDIADLYKADLTIPLAFRIVADGVEDLEGRVRRARRDTFHAANLLQRIVPDLDRALGAPVPSREGQALRFDIDEAAPGGLWDPDQGEVEGGVSLDSIRKWARKRATSGKDPGSLRGWAVGGHSRLKCRVLSRVFARHRFPEPVRMMGLGDPRPVFCAPVAF